MQWLNQIVEKLIARHPEGEILVESGSAPSGAYHTGHLREFVTPDAIMVELRRRGRQARHIHFVDDLDALRKVPVNVPAEYEQYLGMPLCDIPAPDGSDRSYADYFLQDLRDVSATLGLEIEFVFAHDKYRSGFMVPAIERALDRLGKAKHALETISGRTLDTNWSPIQLMENGRLKNRKFIELNKENKTITYLASDGTESAMAYDNGLVKLDWRLDWPGRWWLLGVDVEPFGRDHATKGGSWDTGVQIMKAVYEAPEPHPVPYDFINMVGDTKKMSASKGTGLTAVELSTIMPAEVVLFFILRYAPSKRLYFDPVNGVMQLMDEFAALAAKNDRSESDEQLLYICTHGFSDKKTVSRIPFSHLVASYQASLRNADTTLAVIKRTEHAATAEADADIIRGELRFIDAWLDKRAPEDIKFSLRSTIDAANLNEQQRIFLQALGNAVAKAPVDADGSWFHDAIYALKDEMGMPPKELFVTLYEVLIGKQSGPRAGWFLSILPRDWLVARLRLEA